MWVRLMFLGDVLALRLGTAKAGQVGLDRQQNGSELKEGRMKDNAQVGRGESFASSTTDIDAGNSADGLESQQVAEKTSGSQVIGVMVLEFGVILRAYPSPPLQAQLSTLHHSTDTISPFSHRTWTQTPSSWA